MHRFAVCWALALVACLAPSCGGSEQEEAAAEEDAGDGRYHPGTDNGARIPEEAACLALKDAYEDRLLALDCTGTTRPCPQLLRAQFSTECQEYDEGSVQGCVAYYGAAQTCPDLLKASDDCAITPFGGSAPKGCP